MAEYDNVFATWNVNENTAGAALPFVYQADFPVDNPSGTFNNGIGGNQPNNIICNIGNGASNEGPDVDINVTVPVGSTTCEGVSFTVCRVGDFNGTNEVVWVWDRENNQILGCIAGTGGSECQGFGAVDCVTVMLDPVQFNAMAVDGMVQIALVTPGGSPTSNSVMHVDDNCTPLGSSSGNTGNCFRLDNFMYNIGNVDPTVSITNVTGDCEDGPFTLTAIGVEDPNDTPSSLGYSWSTGDMTASISVNPTEGTTYTVTVTDLGSFNQGCTATETITVTPKPTSPVVVDTNIDLCNGESLPITVTPPTPPSPVTIFEERFDQNGAGVVGDCDDGDSGISSPTDCGNYTAPTNNQWTLTGSTFDLGGGGDGLRVVGNELESRDIDGTICFEATIDISGVSTADFSLVIGANSTSMNNSDQVEVNYILDGTSVNSNTFVGDISGNSQTVSETGLVGNTLIIEVCFTVNDNNDDYTLDDVVVTGTSGSSTPTYNYYDEDPSLNAAASPVATGTTYSPTVLEGELEMIWVTCEIENDCESDAVMVTIDNLCCPNPTAPIGVIKN